MIPPWAFGLLWFWFFRLTWPATLTIEEIREVLK